MGFNAFVFDPETGMHKVIPADREEAYVKLELNDGAERYGWSGCGVSLRSFVKALYRDSEPNWIEDFRLFFGRHPRSIAEMRWGLASLLCSITLGLPESDYRRDYSTRFLLWVLKCRDLAYTARQEKIDRYEAQAREVALIELAAKRAELDRRKTRESEHAAKISRRRQKAARRGNR